MFKIPFQTQGTYLSKSISSIRKFILNKHIIKLPGRVFHVNNKHQKVYLVLSIRTNIGHQASNVRKEKFLKSQDKFRLNFSTFWSHQINQANSASSLLFTCKCIDSPFWALFFDQQKIVQFTEMLYCKKPDGEIMLQCGT